MEIIALLKPFIEKLIRLDQQEIIFEPTDYMSVLQALRNEIGAIVRVEIKQTNCRGKVTDEYIVTVDYRAMTFKSIISIKEF